MTPRDFVSALIVHMHALAAGDIQFIQSTPPGRTPLHEDIKMHNWYKSLSHDSKHKVDQLIYSIVERTAYSILLLLDHKMFLEGVGEKGQLELYYRSPIGEQTRLNPPNGYQGKDLEYYFKLLRTMPTTTDTSDAE